MEPADQLVNEGNYCKAKKGDTYLIYLPYGGEASLDLSGVVGNFTINWFNRREGGEPIPGESIKAGSTVELG